MTSYQLAAMDVAIPLHGTAENPVQLLYPKPDAGMLTLSWAYKFPSPGGITSCGTAERNSC